MYHTDLPPARDIIYKYTCISFKTVAFTIGTSVKDAAPVYMEFESYTVFLYYGPESEFFNPFNNFNGHLLL